MFRIALVLFKHVLGRPDQLAECPTMYETMEKLRKIPASYMEEEFLVQEVCSFPDSVGVANVVVVVVVVESFTSRMSPAIQWQHHQLSAITAAHPPAWSVTSC